MKSSHWSIAVLVAWLAAGCVLPGCAARSEEARRPDRPKSKPEGSATVASTSDPAPADSPTSRPSSGTGSETPDPGGTAKPATGPEERATLSTGEAPPRPSMMIEPTPPEGPTALPFAAESYSRPAIVKSVAPDPGVRSPGPRILMAEPSLPVAVSTRQPDAPATRVVEAPPAERTAEVQPVETAAKPGAESAAESPPDPAAAPTQDVGFTRVKVYYGTDRARNALGGPSPLSGFPWQTWLMVSAAVTIALASLACFRPKKRLLKGLVAAGVLATLVLGMTAAWSRVDRGPSELAPDELYGNERGEVELGICEVSIPERHETGELEGPSVFRLDFHENPQRHVVLLGVTPQPAGDFFADCQTQVANSKNREAFVFVHGYNVSFEDAARRTAQLAYDLRFDGAPIFFSWPSQSGLLKYAVDETNAAWTVPHLKEFLLEVARRSGAKSIHVIAHSMGNRALTSALQSLSYELRDDAKIFREVVLTAPDIDADVFRRDIAPAIVKTAQRVTLYASSKDEALALSRKFHGYPRAGDSGSDLVVVPGIDTIDVSAVDTSLLGHSYYSSNDSVLADLTQLLLEDKPPQERPWLRAAQAGALRYWVLLCEQVGNSGGSPLWR